MSVRWEDISTSAQRVPENIRPSDAGVIAETPFERLFANAPDGILVLDGDRRCVDVNSAACELFGATREQIVGQSLDSFVPLDQGEHDLGWQRLMDERWVRGEFRLTRMDEQVRDVEFTSVADFMPGMHLEILRDVTKRRREEEAFRTAAERDGLTGVLNHGAIFAEVARLVDSETPFSLAVVDVDGLKATNDTHGHLIGDAVLRRAAQLISRFGTIVGRWGGDEFLMLVPGADRAQAEASRESIMEEAARSSITDDATGNRIGVRITIGTAIYPTEARSADALIRIADGAMYATRKNALSRRINNSDDGGTVSKLMGELIPLLATKADLASKVRLVAQHLSLGAGYDGVDFQLFRTETEAPVMLTTYLDKPGALSTDEWTQNQQVDIAGDHGLRRLILSTRRAIIFNDIESDDRLAQTERTLLLRTGIRSGVLIPLVWQEEVIGTLGIGNKEKNGFHPADIDFLLAVCSQVTPIIQMGALIEDLNAASDRLAAAQTETVMMLAAAAEASDPGTGQHLRRVSEFSELIAIELGIPAEVASAVGMAAILHDIGKIRVPSTILLKPGSLTEEEWAVMRQHAAWGSAFLLPHAGFEIAAAVAGAHHERWDGTGYPAGLAAGAISEAARIVSVADAFDAITTDRPYRMGRSYDWAIEEICRGSGSQFDPRVVAALERLHARRALVSMDGPEASIAA